MIYIGDSTMDMDKERLHQEDLQRIRGFRLIDDDFMNACFDDNIEATELILRIILGRDDISVKSVKTQRLMKNLLGRDVWLDIDAVDSENRELDIEVQRADRGAGRKRARYHSSILDAHLLRPGEDFDELPETYVIFITEHDVFKGNQPLYFIERQNISMGTLFDDGEHIVYVNGESRDGQTELSKLMHDFFCTDPDDMHFKALAEKTRFFKQDEKGVAAMCKVMEDMRSEVAREAAKEAAWQTKMEVVLRFLGMGLSFEQVAQGTDLTVEQVKEIPGQKSA